MTYLLGENLVAGYGGADILHGCSIDVSEGEIAVIVGPNGSGKSTAMKAIFGMLKLQSPTSLRTLARLYLHLVLAILKRLNHALNCTHHAHRLCFLHVHLMVARDREMMHQVLSALMLTLQAPNVVFLPALPAAILLASWALLNPVNQAVCAIIFML